MEYSADSYLGVDVVKSGSRLSDFTYSIALIRGGSLVKVDEVSASRLIRLLWELKPSVLAVDNLLELGGSIRNVSIFVKLVPPGVKVVQVNVDEKSLRDLRLVAREVGIELPHGKLDSKLSAVVIAFLASRGFGREVEVFSKKVKIYVHRGRSGRAGGSSANRFKRNLRASVAQVVKKIEELLRSRSIEYDVAIRRSRGGVESAVFTVYCDREKLYGLVKNAAGRDVVVRVRPVVNLASIRHLVLSQEHEQKPLIVGLDPGIEVGLAVLDFSGRIVMLKSSRGLDREDVISILRNLGRVVLVATDKQQPPEFVRKVAAALGARVYAPDRDLQAHEKESVVREYSEVYGVEVKNNHMRDSLAAAIEAYRSIEGKIRELEERLTEMGLDRVSINLDKYKVKVVECLPIAAIVEEIITESLSGEESADRVLEIMREARALVEVNEAMKRRIRELERLVESLSTEKQQLLAKIRSLENELSRLKSIVDSELSNISRSVMRDRKVYELTQRLINVIKDLDNLRAEHEKIREQYLKLANALPGIASDKLLAVRKVSTVEQIENLTDLRQGDIVFVENPTLDGIEKTAHLIEKLDVRLVLPESFPEESLLKVVNEMAVPAVREVGYVAVDSVAIVSSEIRNKLSEVVEKVKEIRRMREVSKRGLSIRDLENIIREYRELRKELSSE
ncbi:MAG: DUF460 domain-containing protein [Sulfolobales archaeon]|nr:DUF460 domain-containing protein [Sulfolobales archaeon]MCX8208370.1 DUF460 domain-containing protein [Sulfolobales archaeon]MDW8010547.1 DUF460 domain-containing protein [Sulfolobales archaeon]